MTVVLGCGQTPCDVMLIGEAPGSTEASTGTPFSGASGGLLRTLLRRFGIQPHLVYMTNVVKAYLPGNPDPTPDLLAAWLPVLQHEIDVARPRLIITAGRYSTVALLGHRSQVMEACHGILHPPNCFGPAPIRTEAAVLPCYHPAYALHDPDMLCHVEDAYKEAGRIATALHTGPIRPVQPDRAPCNYADVTGQEFAEYLRDYSAIPYVGLDTEGYPTRPWSVQVSRAPRTGVTLRYARPDFSVGATALRDVCASPTVTTLIHNALYDVELCASMDIDLRRCRIFDSQYAAYLLGLPQGLKSLSWRLLRLPMRSFNALVGDTSRAAQLEYLEAAASRDWAPTPAYTLRQNDGTMKSYKPASISRRVTSILRDVAADKRSKDGEPVDPLRRWRDIPRQVRSQVEQQLGPMPDIDLDRVYAADPEGCIGYACRDADAALRAGLVLQSMLNDRRLP